MSRMHFRAAADIVRQMIAQDPYAASEAAGAFAKLFAQFNPRFDRAKFFAACGL